MKSCPYCRKPVKEEDKKCGYCKADLSEAGTKKAENAKSDKGVKE